MAARARAAAWTSPCALRNMTQVLRPSTECGCLPPERRVGRENSRPHLPLVMAADSSLQFAM